MTARFLPTALACAALLVAGGGEDSGDESTSPRTDLTVKMSDYEFEPRDVAVAPGATIRVTNEGQIAHTVTGDDFDSGSLAPGDTFTFEASEKGSFSYVCTFHPGMQGTIEVR